MKKFFVGGTGFYTLKPGEKISQDDYYKADTVYAIWPIGDYWKVMLSDKPLVWKDISDSHFPTEDIAFSFAYDYFLQNTK